MIKNYPNFYFYFKANFSWGHCKLVRYFEHKLLEYKIQCAKLLYTQKYGPDYNFPN